MNLLALVSEVLWLQTTMVSSSTHFPFGRMNSFFEMPVKNMTLALSTAPLDIGCLPKVKLSLMSSSSQKQQSSIELNCLSLSHVIPLGTPNRHMICFHVKFQIVLDVILARA